MMLHRRFLGILVGLTAVVAAFGQGAFSFKINEVVVSNTDGLIDEYGERTGWIEIANTSWGTNNLRSCYLTTNREALNKGLSVPERVKLMSLIPKGDERTNLTAQQRIVFFADGQTNLGTLHTNFTLRKARKTSSPCLTETVRRCSIPSPYRLWPKTSLTPGYMIPRARPTYG